MEDEIKKLKTLDLFSGIGGFTYGLDKVGFETLAFCELDKHCKKVLNKNYPHIPIYSDVKKIGYEDGYLTYENFPEIKTSIEVICGGFPCTDISIAGRQKGFIDEKGNPTRSGLWFEYKRIIEEVRPKYVIIENVGELRNKGLVTVLRDLDSIGYDAEWYTLTAVGVANLPHQRERLFIISYPRCLGCNEYFREERHLSPDKKWPDTQTHIEGKRCKSESIPFRPLLSRRAIEDFRNTHSDRRAIVSSVRRVTNGVPDKLGENLRKEEIKQLGNAIVPDIAELIGREIYKREFPYIEEDL